MPDDNTTNLLREASDKVTALKQHLDVHLKTLFSDTSSNTSCDIELQLQASCQEFLQCAEALLKGYTDWSEVPLNVQSV